MAGFGGVHKVHSKLPCSNVKTESFVFGRQASIRRYEHVNGVSTTDACTISSRLPRPDMRVHVSSARPVQTSVVLEGRGFHSACPQNFRRLYEANKPKIAIRAAWT